MTLETVTTMPVTLGLETLGPMSFRLVTLRPDPPCPGEAVKPGGNTPVEEPGPFHGGLLEKITMAELLVLFKLLGYQGKQANAYWYVAA